MTIKDLLLDFIGIWSNQNNIYSMQCTVKSVDVTTRTCVCTPTDGSADILNVRLEADLAVNSDDVPIASSKKGFFVVPKVNSIVGVTFFDKTNAFINVWTEIDEVYVISNKFTFNNGAFGGLIKIDDLVSRLNDYESLFTQLQTDFNAWTPVPNDGGLALKTILSTGFLTKTVPSTVKGDFENTKVIHG
jgi:hypothetical protein